MDSYCIDWYQFIFILAFEIVIGIITITIDLTGYFHEVGNK